MKKEGFRFAYLVVALIAVVSFALSLLFTSTGEAEESNGKYLMPSPPAEETPFIISNTSQGWLVE